MLLLNIRHINIYDVITIPARLGVEEFLKLSSTGKDRVATIRIVVDYLRRPIRITLGTLMVEEFRVLWDMMFS